MQFENFVLNETQKKIILELLQFRKEETTSHGLQDSCGISASSWYQEKKKLDQAGLIKAEEKKKFAPDGSPSKARYHSITLTPKGRLVALLIAENYNMMWKVSR